MANHFFQKGCAIFNTMGIKCFLARFFICMDFYYFIFGAKVIYRYINLVVTGNLECMHGELFLMTGRIYNREEM